MRRKTFRRFARWMAKHHADDIPPLAMIEWGDAVVEPYAFGCAEFGAIRIGTNYSVYSFHFRRTAFPLYKRARRMVSEFSGSAYHSLYCPWGTGGDVPEHHSSAYWKEYQEWDARMRLEGTRRRLENAIRRRDMNTRRKACYLQRIDPDTKAFMSFLAMSGAVMQGVESTSERQQEDAG